MHFFCTLVSPVCTSVHFCVTSLHFSALQILLVMKSAGTSAFILFVSKKCTNISRLVFMTETGHKFHVTGQCKHVEDGLKVCYVTWRPKCVSQSDMYYNLSPLDCNTLLYDYESGSSHGARQKLLGKFVYLLVSDRFEHGFLLKTVFAACDIL